MDFDELSDAIRRLHASGSYDEALGLLGDLEATLVVEHGATVRYWRSCLLSLLDRPGEAVEELRRGAAEGRWWARPILEGDPDLSSARLDEGFAAIVSISEAAKRKALSSRAAEPVTLLQPVGEAIATLVVLHGGRGPVSEITDIWAAASNLGCLVAIPGRGQVLTSDGDFRNWTDSEETRRDVAAAVHAASPSSVPLLIAGFSAGGREALRIALTEEPEPFSGVIAFGPPPLDLAELGVERRRDPRAWVFVGEDDWALDGAVRMVEEMRAMSLDVSLDRAPGVGHELPDDFQECLSAALDYLLGAD